MKNKTIQKIERMKKQKLSKPKKVVALKPDKHENCRKKIREQYSDENTEYIRFDLHTIRTFVGNTIVCKNKSGQRVWVKDKNKIRETKSFIGHDYCPWCGKKY